MVRPYPSVTFTVAFIVTPSGGLWDTDRVAPPSGPRSPEQRKADALEKLTALNADVWVASSSASGSAHLVPLSLAWDGARVIVAVEASSVTARNVAETQRARMALGNTRDVVMIDATLDELIPGTIASDELADAYLAQTFWDPRAAGPGQVFLALRPDRVQVWREVDEIVGRTIMRAGLWVA